MPCLITALTRSAIKKLQLKTNSNTRKNKNFTAKTQYLNLKAPSNYVKMQSDETLTTHLIFLSVPQMDFFKKNFLMRRSKKCTKRRNSEAKFKKSTIFNTIYFGTLKNH